MRFQLALMMIAAVLATGTLAIACGDDDDGDTGDPTAAGTDGEDVQARSIELRDDLVFEPDELTVTAGQPVQLTVDNSASSALHDWTISEIAVENVDMHGASEDMGHMDDMEGHEGGEANLHIAVDGGRTATITFTPTRAGEYEFHCSVTGHAEAGMVGTLIVTE